MSSKDIKKKAVEYAKQVGKPEARRQLVLEGVSPHTADKIISGRYPCEIGYLLSNAIERVISAKRSA